MKENELEMIIFSFSYGLYCIFLEKVSFGAVAISFLFWIAVNLFIFSAKKKEECIDSVMHLLFLICIKLFFCRKDTLPNDLVTYLSINFMLCNLYCCSFYLKKMIRGGKTHGKKESDS